MNRKSGFKIILIIGFVAVITLLHFSASRGNFYLHGIYQHLYYIPIILASFWFRLRGGILTSLSVTICYFFYSSNHPVLESGLYVEMIFYNIVGVVTGLLSSMEKKQREKSEKTAEDLRNAYQKLQTTYDQLKQADRLAALGELSAGLAHEIGNPLGSIKGSIDILENEFDDANPKREFIVIIKSEVERLNRLLSEFTHFAKPPEPELRDTDINEIFSSLIPLITNIAEQQKVNIIPELRQHLPTVLVDSEQIKQVLLNIFINGIQSMPKGGNLFIKTDVVNSSLEISVKDEGVGIESKKISKIFNPFFTTKKKGTGLGLSISYQLIKKHGGDIIVTPNPDRGLTFTVNIPIGKQQ